MIRAGLLRHMGALEAFVATGTGPRGQPVGTWQTIHSNVPMQIIPLGGRLAEIKRQLVPTASHQIWLRWIEDVIAGMRVRYEGRYFAIGYVDDGDFKQHDLGLTCTEVSGETQWQT